MDSMDACWEPIQNFLYVIEFEFGSYIRRHQITTDEAISIEEEDEVIIVIVVLVTSSELEVHIFVAMGK
jgi:hypothetical protein